MSWQQEFPQQSDLIYLNHAAVSPWPERTKIAISKFAQENVSLGAQNYPQWISVETRLRERLKELINAPKVDNIALLKNTSEALSVIAYGINWKPGDNLVISNQEFPSNRIVWESLANQGVQVKVADLDGPDSPEQSVIQAFDQNTRLLSISSVQYASGLKVDCETLGAACKDRDILFCIDAIQSIGAQVFDVQKYQADFVVADGHKWMLGPEGLALFYSHAEARKQLTIRQFGWHMVKHRGNYDRQEWEPTESALRFECGSPNMLGTYALEASLSLIQEVGMPQIEQLLHEKVQYLENALRELPNIELLGDDSPERRAGIVTFKLGSKDTKKIHGSLMAKRIICAHRGGGIRFSPHFYTPIEKIDRALEQLRLF